MTRLPFFALANLWSADARLAQGITSALPPRPAEPPAGDLPAPRLVDTFAVLVDLAGCAAEWQRRGRPVLARCIKEDCISIVERYFDDELTREAANAELHTLHKRIGLELLADDEMRATQLAAARGHAAATATRWVAEDWTEIEIDLPTPPSHKPNDVIDSRD